MSEKLTATWSVSLYADCPHCKEYVDLMDYPDFWIDRDPRLVVCEHDTDNSRNVDVVCPDCRESFKVDLEY